MVSDNCKFSQVAVYPLHIHIAYTIIVLGISQLVSVYISVSAAVNLPGDQNLIILTNSMLALCPIL